MDSLVSVIVPVYNVEKYLGECINSLLCQIYTNLEIILIDDGSTDSSGTLCDHYAEIDNRISVYHKKNGGLSDARNYGLDIATGEFIAFVDSDDYVSPYFIDRLRQVQKKTDSDIVICGFTSFDDGTSLSCITNETDDLVYQSVSSIDALSNFYNDNRVMTVLAWNKLYKKSCFKTIRFPVGKLREDEFISYRVIYASNKITYIQSKLYYYRTRPGSIMQSSNLKVYSDYVLALMERRAFFKSKKSTKKLLPSDTDFILSELFVILLENSKRFSLEEYKEIHGFFVTTFKERQNLQGLPWRIVTYRYLPRIYSLFVRIKRIIKKRK